MKFIYKIFIYAIVFTITFSYVTVYSFSDSYIWTNASSVEASSSTTNKVENNLEIESEAAILIDQSTGQILFEKDAHKQLRPASVTKVMTILLIMEALDSGKISLDTKIPCSENAASMGGSQIWLDVREELTVDEMLKAICVVSANDCTVQKRHENFPTENLVS